MSVPAVLLLIFLLLFGKNEAGKTTIRKFMISMLFGLERARGVAAENDDYIRYMPVNGGNYGGSVTIRKGKTFYRIIRDFSKEQKNLRMFYEDTMEEINLPVSLILYSQMLFCHCQKVYAAM